MTAGTSFLDRRASIRDRVVVCGETGTDMDIAHGDALAIVYFHNRILPAGLLHDKACRGIIPSSRERYVRTCIHA
jgi:hypothetical protein